MIQAVAQTRMTDFMRAADRRRIAAGKAESRRSPLSGRKAVDRRRRLRIGIA
jgi:hypothetical protein